VNIKKYRLQYSQEDIEFVKKEIEKSLKIGYLTDGGPNIDLFEKLWCDFNKSKYSIAVSNCTAGLECILRALDVKGKSVVVPAYTFIASVMSIYNCMGTPIYADISRDTFSLSLESIKRAVRKDTKAVMIVHVGGVISNEITEIRKYCDENNLFLIEDAACAHGAEFNDTKSGNFGHAACFSFHHSKVLTSGEGGIITTDSLELNNRIKRIRAIGLDRSINNYESFEIGSNSKMSEITATLAILHTKKADKIISERRKIAKRYDTEINFNESLHRFKIPDNTKSGYYKYFVVASNNKVKSNFYKFMKSKNIDLPPAAYEYTCDKQAISKKMKCIKGDNLLNSYFMKDHNVCLPMYNGLTQEEISYIVENTNKFIENVSNANKVEN
jgi:perosamine synthetase